MNPFLQPTALSLQEASVYSGLSRSSLYRKMNEGELASLKVGARRLIRRSDLDAFLDRAAQNAA